MTASAPIFRINRQSCSNWPWVTFTQVRQMRAKLSLKRAQLSTTSVSTTLVDDLDTQDVIRHFRALADAALDETCEPDAPVFQPSRWGPFEIIREIGHGGYGAVYLAWESTLERAVALKLLHHAD